ncbi:hypothetical protein PHMEG_0006464, partial [Phytophthora megakarya]
MNALCLSSSKSPWRLVNTDRFYTSVKLALELLNATTARERAVACPSREEPPPAPATPTTAVISGHYPEENPDMRNNTQGLKHRQRSCKVCAIYKSKPSKFPSTSVQSVPSGIDVLCNVARSRAKTCFAIWHEDWNNGNDIPSLLLQDHKMRDRPRASHPGKKRRRRTES